MAGQERATLRPVAILSFIILLINLLNQIYLKINRNMKLTLVEKN